MATLPQPQSRPSIPPLVVGGKTYLPKTSTSSSSYGSSPLPQSSPSNITPAAASGQTMESVAAQSVTPSQVQTAATNLAAGKINTRVSDMRTLTQATANSIGVKQSDLTPVQFAKYSGSVIQSSFNQPFQKPSQSYNIPLPTASNYAQKSTILNYQSPKNLQQQAALIQQLKNVGGVRTPYGDKTLLYPYNEPLMAIKPYILPTAAEIKEMYPSVVKSAEYPSVKANQVDWIGSFLGHTKQGKLNPSDYIESKVVKGFAEPTTRLVTKYFLKSELPTKDFLLYKLPFSYTDYGKLAFFSPLMSTAAAAKQVQKQVQVKSSDKGSVYVRNFEKMFAEEGRGKVLERLKKISEDVQKAQTAEQKEIGVHNLKILLKDLSDKGIIKLYAVGEDGRIYLSDIITKPAASMQGKTFQEVLVELFPKAKLKQVASVVQASTFFVPSKQTMPEATTQQQLTWLGTATKQTLKTQQKTEQQTKQKTAQVLMLSTKTEQQTQQQTAQKELQGLSTSLFFRTAQAQQQQPKQQQPRLFFNFPQYPRKPQQPEKPNKPKEENPPKDEDEEKKLLFKRRRIKTENLFIPEVRRRGKFIPVSTPTSYERALATAAGKVQQTLAASFRIKKSTGGFVPIPTNKIFRAAKKNPFIGVQRRKYRLSSPFEVGEIQESRKGKIKFI